jgi:hypothetical protein
MKFGLNFNLLKNILYSNYMFNTITICSTLFGSVYLCSVSLALINNSLLEEKKISKQVMLLNGLTFLASGSVFFGYIGLHYSKFIKQH